MKPDSIGGIIEKGCAAGILKCIEGSTSVEYVQQNVRGDLSKPEEPVRAQLFCRLVTDLGYRNSKSIVDIEVPRKIGHPDKKSDTRADIIVYSPKDSGLAFMLIETKSWDEYDAYLDRSIETQLFERAATEDKGRKCVKYLVYYTAADENGKLTEKFVTIDYSKYTTYDGWVAAGRDNLRFLPNRYNKQDRKPEYVHGVTESELRTGIGGTELDRIAKSLHSVLWAGGKYQNELFFNLIGLFLAKIWDEKSVQVGKPYQFQVWYDGDDQESPEATAKRMNVLYHEALKELLKLPAGELKKIRDIVFDANKVKYVVEELQAISFLSNQTDMLGDFFESIVRNELKQTKGQYLTHQNIVDFILYGLKLDELAVAVINSEHRLPYLIDPSCGSGTFLIHAMRIIDDAYVAAKVADRITRSEIVAEFEGASFGKPSKNAWARVFIYGIEINSDLAMASKVNMVGHGDGSAHIELADGLTAFDQYHERLAKTVEGTTPRDYCTHKKSIGEQKPIPVNEQFDVVVSNPPFSIQVDKDTAKLYPDLFQRGEKVYEALKSRKEGEEQAVDTETLFVERWYQLLAPGGRLGVILPESVFDTAVNLDVRRFLYRFFTIKAVVSLPQLAFAPYTLTKTSILFAKKKTPEQVAQWDASWVKYTDEFKTLKKKLDQILRAEPNQPLDKKTDVADVLQLALCHQIPEEDRRLTEPMALLEKYRREAQEVTRDWWVFRRVSTEHNGRICMAHAEEIGYKRGLRGVENRPNELFRSVDGQGSGSIVTDSDPATTILEWLRREIRWDD